MAMYQIEVLDPKTHGWKRLQERPYPLRQDAETERHLYWDDSESRIVEVAEVYAWKPDEFLGAQA